MDGTTNQELNFSRLGNGGPTSRPNKFNRFGLFLVLALILAGSFWGGMKYQEQRAPEENVPSKLIETSPGVTPEEIKINLLWDVLSKLRQKYVDQGKFDNERELLYGAVKGMVASLGDPYTVFLPPAESKQFEEQIRGSFGGVGIEIGLRKNSLTVIAPIKNTPAEQAGILAGDVIVKIDDKDTEGLSIDQAVSKIRGKIGTTVKDGKDNPLGDFRRGSEDKFRDFVLRREEIHIPSIEWELVDGHIAHIQLLIFNANIESDFRKMAAEIRASQADRIVLDLRNNPGGLLDSAVNIASYFLNPGQTVVIQRFGDGQESVAKSENNGSLKQYPLVIIVNKGSASASEILAGALRDNNGAKVIGETSYGKGSVQELVGFGPNETSGTLKVTIAKWFTPSGLSINENGIKPDIEVKITEEDLENKRDPQLEKAKEIVKGL